MRFSKGKKESKKGNKFCKRTSSMTDHSSDIYMPNHKLNLYKNNEFQFTDKRFRGRRIQPAKLFTNSKKLPGI